MVEGSEEQGEFGQEGRHQNALLYSDYGMVASSDPRWLHGAFITLVGLFNRVGLWTNVRKIFGMVCHQCQATGNQLEAEYGQRMTGKGTSKREQHKRRVQCRECGEDMAAVYLESHRMTQHRPAAEDRWRWNSSTIWEEPRMYHMVFPAKGGPWK